MQQSPNTSVPSESKPTKPQLSKSHLISLFAMRKIKTAKIYISELKNSNPKAQKAIKQALFEIFSSKQIPSATAYMYGLVFYKNLLISAQMDYYEDEEFFPLQIHSSIVQICEYNPQQQDIKLRGADYFSYAIKFQNKQNEDLQATGKGVVVFALQLIQTMGELYKQSYLTGEESFFTKKYHELIGKGVTFPKWQEYLYIKEQDKKQFQQNYAKLLQAGQIQEEQENQNKQSINNLQTKQMSLSKNKIQQNQIKKKEPISVQKPSLIQTIKQQKTPLLTGISEILKQVQQKKVKEEVNRSDKKVQNPQQQQKETVRTQKQVKPLTKPTSSIANVVQNARQEIIFDIDQKQTSRKQNNFSQNKKKENEESQKQLHVNTISPSKLLQTTKSMASSARKDQKQISSIIRKSFKRTEFPPEKKKPQQIIDYDNLLSIDSSQLHSKFKQPQNINTLKHKHRIFEQFVPNSSKNELQSKPQLNQLEINSTFQQQNTISDSILSFSPKLNTDNFNIIRPSPHKSKKKSVPKTEKKHNQQRISDNFQQLAFKLNATQKFFDNKNKKAPQNLPTKTLSTWRCEKTVQNQFDPSFFQTDILEQVWSMSKHKQLPFVPEYFYPTTLKMSGLRRAALQLCDFTSRSEIFFNNNVIAARLMKPSQNYFILSLENVSGKDFIIRVMDKKDAKGGQESVKLVDKNDKKMKLLRNGTFIDVRFVFMTNELNFKFLTIDLQINDKMLTLQLPVTLLDSCTVKDNVDTNEISSLVRKSGKFWDSEPFSINPDDVPKFIISENSQMQFYNQKKFNKFVLPTAYFTISLRSSKQVGYREQNTLYCRLNEAPNSEKKYQLSFLFNRDEEDSQNFAKVMMELLMFSLCQ